MRIPNQALILVADGRKCLFLRNTGSPDSPALAVEEHREREDARTHEQGTDSPGRVFARVGSRRSAVEQTDFQRLDEERFAADAATLLNRRAQAGEFEALVVVAPPQTLGELRRHYDPAVQGRLLAEIGKDLTGHPIPEIAAILAD